MRSRKSGFRSTRFLSTSLLTVLLTVASCTGQARLAAEAFDRGEYEKAMDLWMPLADDGDAKAQFGIGYLYDHGLGVPADSAEAIRWYRMSADQGYVLSQLNLGALYQEGREDLPADLGRAADWFRLAADQGNANAQYNLGKLYHRGQGLPRNNELAAQWLQKAADQGHVKAINLLGTLYTRGLGVEADPERGFQLVLQAAQQGDPAAQLNLAGQYIRGTGTEQDFVEALKWHTIFESHDIPGGGLPMDWVENNMTRADIEEAQRRAAQWLAEHSTEPEE